MRTKLLCLLCLGAVFLIPTIAIAVTDFYLASYGGTFEQALKEDLGPIFEKKFNCKINYVIGISSETIAKVRIQKGNPEVDVAILDDGPSSLGSGEGLWANLDPKIVTNLSRLYPIALHPDNNGVDMGVLATGLMYNTQIFKEKGFPPPTSWMDVGKPEYSQRFVMPPIGNTYGLHALIMFARINGGSEKNINPGFEAMKNLKKNILEFPFTPAKMSELFQSKEAWIGINGSSRVYSLSDTGFPVDFVYPKEGGVSLGISINMVKNCKNPSLAQEFINFMLEERSQGVWSKIWSLGPMNKNVKLDPGVAKKVPYGTEQMNKLLKVDWAFINEHRAEWTERWSKEVETR